MAFCTNCGASAEGQFCVKCGAPVGAPAPPAAVAVPAAEPARRKTSPLVWILVGILGLIVLGVIGVVGVGIYIARHPAAVVTRLLAANNPNLEVVSTSGDRITVRDKRTGKVSTLDYSDLKQGRIRLKGEDGEDVTVDAKGSGDSGSVEVKSGGQTMKFGTSAKMPDWVPVYPGADVKGGFSAQGAEGEGGAFQLSTKDAPGKVLAFYEEKLKAAGFQITSNISGVTGGSSGGMLAAENDQRSVAVLVSAEGGGTNATITIGTKK